MALEAPAAPAAATSTQAPNAANGASPAQNQGLKTTRTRNEYPEAYDELESLERATPPKADKAAPAASAKAEPDKAPDKPAAPEKPAKEPPPAAKPAETAKATPPADKPADDGLTDGEPDPTAQFKTAHDLRKAYRKLHKEVVPTLEKEVAELRAKAQNGGADRAILDEHKKLQARLEEVEGELRYHAYTKSKEFIEKFRQPYERAYEDAVEDVKDLYVTTADGGTRPATERDLQAVLRADHQEVRKIATELFGDAAEDVLSYRRKLNAINRDASREEKRYREEAAEREKQQTLKTAEEKAQTEAMWKKAVGEVREKYKHFFGPVEGDDEYNKQLESGYSSVDMAHNPSLPIEEKVARLAVLRHKAAAFGAQVLKNKRLEARVAELEEVVAGYEKSAPGAGKGSEADRVPHGGDDGSGYADANAEIEALAGKDTTEE